MKTALIIIFLIISVILAIIVMMQEGKGGGFINSSVTTESYWGKNKGKSKDAVLRKITAVLGFAYIVLALLLSSKFFK